MRTLIAAFLLFLCAAAQSAAPDQAPAKQKLSADTPQTTALGNTFIAPAGWSVAVRGPATIVEAPEGDSRIVIVDVRAKDADAAVAAGWAAYQPPKWPLKVTNDVPDKDGWSKQRNYAYQTSPNERRDVGVGVSFANDVWTVVIYDMTQAVGEKRGAQVALIFDKLLPKGYSRETFAGKKAQRLDAARIAKLTKFMREIEHLSGEELVQRCLDDGVGIIVDDGYDPFFGRDEDEKRESAYLREPV